MRRFLFALALLLAAAGPAGAAPDPATGKPILTAGIEGPITPVTLEFATQAIARAEQGGFGLLLFVMNTPGGSADSTEGIIRAVLASSVPVGVYVTPAGAQAASAGLYIINASDVAAMAPGTRIGAGHPVMISPIGSAPASGESPQRDVMSEKVENDMAAGVRSIATIRGRNAAVYEQMVRKSISLTEREAVDQNVVELVAADLPGLLAALEGRTVKRFDGTTQALHLDTARVELFEMTRWQWLLSLIADPRIAFLLLSIGMLGLYAEFNHPGLILPGAIGAVALLLFGISTQVLPINAVGFLLIILAAVLFALEVKFTSYGLLTVGGIVCLTVGFLVLYDVEEMPTLQVSLAFILPTSLTVGAVMGGITLVAMRAQRLKVVTGVEGLAGEVGEAVTDIAAAGKVFVHGEYWNAKSRAPIPRGKRVRVVAVGHMDLEVEPEER